MNQIKRIVCIMTVVVFAAIGLVSVGQYDRGMLADRISAGANSDRAVAAVPMASSQSTTAAKSSRFDTFSVSGSYIASSPYIELYLCQICGKYSSFTHKPYTFSFAPSGEYRDKAKMVVTLAGTDYSMTTPIGIDIQDYWRGCRCLTIIYIPGYTFFSVSQTINRAKGYGNNGYGVYNVKIGDYNDTDFIVNTQVTLNWYGAVNFDPQGGTGGATPIPDATTGKAIPTRVVAPTRANYTFQGYYTAPNGGGTQYYDAGGASVRNNWEFYPDSDSVTLYALWKADRHVVTVVLDGGSAPVVNQWDYNKTYTLVEPTKEHYRFTGWTHVGAGSLNGNTFTVGAGNANLTANWQIDAFPVNLDPNGGAIDGSSAPITQRWDYNSAHALPTPARIGYTFAGWTLVGAGSLAGNTFTVGDEAATLTANWQLAAFSVTLDPNGGAIETSSAPVIQSWDYNSAHTLPVPVRAGYTFAGWTLEGKGSLVGNTFTVGEGAATLSAEWTPSLYAVAIDPNGGLYGQSADVIFDSWACGSTHTLSAPVREGYEFLGWSLLGKGTLTDGTVFTVGSGAATLTANWRIRNYDVTLFLDGGTVDGATLFDWEYGSTHTLPIPVKTGYRFVRWAVDGAGSFHDTQFTVGAGHASLTAEWTPNAYTITLDPDGGMLDGDTSFVWLYNSNRELPIPTKPGFRFGGWELTGAGTLLNGHTLIVGAGDASLKALWLV